MSNIQQCGEEIEKLIFKHDHPDFEWNHSVGWVEGNDSWDRERLKCSLFSEKILLTFKKFGGAFVVVEDGQVVDCNFI